MVYLYLYWYQNTNLLNDFETYRTNKTLNQNQTLLDCDIDIILDNKCQLFEGTGEPDTPTAFRW